jgi:hypothetical protein
VTGAAPGASTSHETAAVVAALGLLRQELSAVGLVPDEAASSQLAAGSAGGGGGDAAAVRRLLIMLKADLASARLLA